jgi:hypothetical protein
MRKFAMLPLFATMLAIGSAGFAPSFVPAAMHFQPAPSDSL